MAKTRALSNTNRALDLVDSINADINFVNAILDALYNARCARAELTENTLPELTHGMLRTLRGVKVKVASLRALSVVGAK